MARSTSQLLLPSLYNFPVRVDALLVYSAFSGSIIRLEGANCELLADWLTGKRKRSLLSVIPEAVLERLVEGGFLTSSYSAQLKEIRARYWGAREDAPMVVTLTTTLDCNLGCYYCYEDRSTKRLEAEDTQSIIERIAKGLNRQGKKSLHVDWYGGEPTLNLAFIEVASQSLQAFCRTQGVSYSASIVSNGTTWPKDIAPFIRRHAIRQVQISFDGTKLSHDKRRRYRSPVDRNDSDSSFETAFNLVTELLNVVRVDIRLNTDSKNRRDLLSFIDEAKKAGWFSKPFQAIIQPARLTSYSDRSAFMRAAGLTLEEFDDFRSKVRARLNDGHIEESQIPDGLPLPKTSVCAALATDSFVVGADQGLYRCGLQVSEQHRSVGRLTPRSGAKIIPIVSTANGDLDWWRRFDPTEAPTCKVCSFLPLCWGGCPKKHLENDSEALKEQGLYWRNNLPRLIASAAGISDQITRPFSQSLQFRNGIPSAEQTPN